MTTNPVLTSDRPNDPDCTDFTLADPNQSIWISIGLLLIYIHPATNGGTVIEVCPQDDYEMTLGYMRVQHPTDQVS